MKKVRLYFIKGTREELEQYSALSLSEARNIKGDIWQGLYAYTTSKDSVHDFEKERNMKIFKKKILKMDDDDYEEFIQQHDGELLEYHVLKTQIKKGMNQEEMFVLMTNREHDIVFMDSYISFGNVINMSELTDAITVMHSDMFTYDYMNILGEVFLLDDIIVGDYPVDAVPWNEFVYDNLSLYFTEFRNTLKEIKQK